MSPTPDWAGIKGWHQKLYSHLEHPVRPKGYHVSWIAGMSQLPGDVDKLFVRYGFSLYILTDSFFTMYFCRLCSHTHPGKFACGGVCPSCSKQFYPSAWSSPARLLGHPKSCITLLLITQEMKEFLSHSNTYQGVNDTLEWGEKIQKIPEFFTSNHTVDLDYYMSNVHSVSPCFVKVNITQFQ